MNGTALTEVRRNMAEFQQVMKQFHRMCDFYQLKRTCPMECPMSGMNISECHKQLIEAHVDAEYIIWKWAKEHPEPIYEYPTWWEYLKSIGVLVVDRIYTERIPKNIADALGIKPKMNIIE